MSRRIEHLLFDNDGTVVDSEIIGQRVMIDLLSTYGFHISHQEYSQRFPGLVSRDILPILQRDYGFVEPEGFLKKLHEAYRNNVDHSFRAIPGMTSLLRQLKVPKSIVSNASRKGIENGLRKLRLRSSIDGQIFSAEQVEKPKPYPDVYLFALENLGLKPHQTLVIEDSPTGISAAKSAGLQSVGFLGAAHIQEGHAQKLQEAGADFIVEDAKALRRLLVSMNVR